MDASASRPLVPRVLEIASVAAWVTFVVLGTIHLGTRGSAAEISGAQLGLLGAALPLSWLLADMASGLIHFVADNLGSPSTPLLGRALIAPFREHHQEPEAILRHSFLERNANNALIALPIIVWIPSAELESAVSLFVATTCLLLAVWVFATNQIHAWAHMESPPLLARILQGHGIVLSPEHHHVHHRAAQEGLSAGGHYCITSGIGDRLLGRLLGR